MSSEPERTDPGCRPAALDLEATWQRWAVALHHHGLTGLVLPLLDLLHLWGFVGGQLFWMLTPFWGREAATLATVLEDPQALQGFRDYLVQLAEEEGHV